MSQKTRSLHPLKRVEHIDVSREMGPEELGNPHYFWMTRHYTMHLECGHRETRAGCNFHYLPAEDFMPKRVRCKECPPKQVPVRPKVNPAYDHLAAELTKAVCAVGSGEDEQTALEWVESNGSWIESDADRAHIYAAVALHVFDDLVPDPVDERVIDLRQSIVDWSKNPTEEAKTRVRKCARRVYRKQKDLIIPWLSVRAIICLGRIASINRASAKGIIESLTWSKEDREGEHHLPMLLELLDIYTKQRRALT